MAILNENLKTIVTLKQAETIYRLFSCLGYYKNENNVQDISLLDDKKSYTLFIEKTTFVYGYTFKMSYTKYRDYKEIKANKLIRLLQAELIKKQQNKINELKTELNKYIDKSIANTLYR